MQSKPLSRPAIGHEIIRLLQISHRIPGQNHNHLSLPVPHHPARDDLAARLHLDSAPVLPCKLIRSRLSRKDDELFRMLRHIAPQALLHRRRITHRRRRNDRLRSQRVRAVQCHHRRLSRKADQQSNCAQQKPGPGNSHHFVLNVIQPRLNPPNDVLPSALFKTARKKSSVLREEVVTLRAAGAQTRTKPDKSRRPHRSGKASRSDRIESCARTSGLQPPLHRPESAT